MVCHPGHQPDDYRTVDGPVATKGFFRSLSTDARPLSHPRWEHGSLQGRILIRLFAVLILAFVVVH
jgi:hypothetical protein